MKKITLKEMLSSSDEELAGAMRAAIEYHLSATNGGSHCDQTMNTLDRIKDAVVVIGIANKDVSK